MKTGITGLPYSGKTTLFCALTGQDYESLPHGKDIHMGTVKVPDERLDRLFDMFQPKKKTNAVMEYFDAAGRTAGQGKTMEPKLLQTLKSADSLIVVVEAFSSGANPRKDFDTLRDEFIFNDLVIVTGRLERLEKDLRSIRRDDLLREKELLERCRDILENEDALTGLDLAAEDARLLRGFQFLSQKPVLVVVNISEDDLSSGAGKSYEAMFDKVENAVAAAMCVEMEKEIAMLDEADRPAFLESLGIEEAALGRVIRLSYQSLGLMSFFTAGGTDEVRAWTVKKESLAPECAGAIHSDLERGFIRAEVVTYDDLMKTGSFKDAREKGLLRVEGKDYVVKDGDILTIRFSV